jgi:hypothetical protein
LPQALSAGERQSVEWSALRLHSYLLKRHWNGEALAGPDVGIRFNARAGRFVKGYLPFRWRDELSYSQAQGYWIVTNWLIHDRDGAEEPKAVALAAADGLLHRQQPGGYWEYPNPEWRGRIATVEGNYATLGLLHAYERTGDDRYFDGAQQWYRFLLDETGFQEMDGRLAVNYFANRAGGMVPNNSTLTVKTLARLAEVSGDDDYLERCPGMVAFIRHAQLETGELPYAVDPSGGGRVHFLCFQYNAFELLDLVEYHRASGDASVLPVIEGLARYLSGGVTASGAARYDCSHDRPTVLYYTAAVGAALRAATGLGLGDYDALASAAYADVLSAQRADGGMSYFSRGDYRVLSDRRSYPRNLAMILYHLLLEAEWRKDRA